MVASPGSWLDYGAAGLLLFVLVAVFVSFRAQFQFYSTRLESSVKFSESIAQTAINALDAIRTVAVESARAQQASTDALQKLAIETKSEHVEICGEIRNLRSDLGKRPRSTGGE